MSLNHKPCYFPQSDDISLRRTKHAQQRGTKRPNEGPGPSKSGGGRIAKRGNSRRRGRKQGFSPNSGTSTVDYYKQNRPQIVLSYQRRSFYQILCSNLGVRRLCNAVFSSIELRGSGMTAGISATQLTYCVAVALYARCAQLAVELGYLKQDIPEISRLQDSVQGLQLPSVLAKYIETLGKFKLAAGPWVAPWFATRAEMEDPHLGTINLDDLLQEAQRPIPANYWSLDSDWIISWNMSSLRNLGMHFRKINWSELTGGIEMIATPTVDREVDVNLFRPTMPQVSTDLEIQLGSVYHWRSFTHLGHWPEETSLICTQLMFGMEFHPDEFWGGIICKTLTTTDQGSDDSDGSDQ